MYLLTRFEYILQFIQEKINQYAPLYSMDLRPQMTIDERGEDNEVQSYITEAKQIQAANKIFI